MRKPQRFLILFAFLNLFTFEKIIAQDWNAIFSLETDAEYYMAEGNFSKAADSYAKALKKFPESANLMFKIGYCLLKTPDRKTEAISYLEEAIKKVSDNYDAKSLKEPNAPPEAFYHLGLAYMLQNNFKNAISSFKEYQKYIKPKDTETQLRAEQSIRSCEMAKSLISSPNGVVFKSLGPDINNESENFNAVLSGDGNTLAYTTRTSSGNKIFISKFENGQWTKPVDITRNLGSKELTTSFLSYEGTELYLIKNDIKNSDIVVSFLQKRKWSAPVRVAKPINSKANETHVCVTRDGNTVYFTSDRKGGQGGSDIWVSTVLSGRWSDPINLGPNINTPFDETTPFLTPDEKYLFFSSQGHNTMGGFDIFYTNLHGNPNVKNIGYQPNTTGDDIFYFPTGLTTGYIATTPLDGYGKYDISKVEILPLVDVKLNILLADNAPTDKPYSVAIINNESGETIDQQTLKGKAQLSKKLKPGSYTFVTSGMGFEKSETPLSIPQKPDKSEYEVSTIISPVATPKPIAQVEEPKEELKTQPANTQPQKIEEKEKPKDQPKMETPKSAVQAKPETPKEAAKPAEKPKPKQERALLPTPKPNAAPVQKMDFNKLGATAELTRPTYSIQLLASLNPVDFNYFKLDSISVTISPDGYYRYSIGNTENIKEIEELLQKVKSHGYGNVWVRINREHPGYTIQILALQKPKSIKQFEDLSDVMVYRGSDGTYRYCIGKYSSPKEAESDLQKLQNMGYNGAFVRVLGQ